jgi:hypothetical protein
MRDDPPQSNRGASQPCEDGEHAEHPETDRHVAPLTRPPATLSPLGGERGWG